MNAQANFEKLADWYNNSAIKIWQEHGHNQAHVPLMIPKINTDIDILFVGMNPSHRAKWIDNQLKKNAKKFNNYSAEDLFAWTEDNLKTRVPYIQLMELHARENDNQYFGALKKVVKDCGLKTWTHLDLFLVRDKDQKNLLQQIEYDEKKNHMNQFGKKQVKLFIETLNKIKPKCIVVNNATTSVFLSKLLVGEHETKTMISYQDTPIFLGGMHSGTRSMDRFSRLRQINEIKQTIKVPQLSQINELTQTIKVPQLNQNPMSMDELYSRFPMSMDELYSRLKQKITDLYKNIYVDELINYYGFKCENIRGRKASFADVYVKAKKIQIQISNTNYDDPKNLVKISRNQKWTLNKHIVLTSHADIQYVIEILRLSYKFVKDSVNE
jgi:predicted transport protein